jgi:hypothetical protein
MKATGPTGHGSRFVEGTAVERLVNNIIINSYINILIFR